MTICQQALSIAMRALAVESLSSISPSPDMRLLKARAVSGLVAAV